MRLRDKAKGRWPEIISALLGEEYTNIRKHQPCPKGEGQDRYRFSDIAGGGQFFCACSDGSADGFELLQCVNGWTFREAAEAVESIIGEADMEPQQETWAMRLRKETIKTKRSGYLESRGLEVAPGLDWHKDLPYYDADGQEIGRYPAMLAPLTRNGKFVTYHVTYLDGGKKADIEPCRKILPGHCKGAGCELYPPRDGIIGVAEGIETAIAAKIYHDIPVHAALNTALLKSWQPPEGVEAVVIYADHDKNFAGQAAAYALAHRLTGKGYDVTVAMPPEAGTDWNDVLLGKRKAS